MQVEGMVAHHPPEQLAAALGAQGAQRVAQRPHVRRAAQVLQPGPSAPCIMAGMVPSRRTSGCQ